MRFYFFRWVQSIVDLADAFVGVFTLGFVEPGWEMRFLAWRAKQNLKPQ